MSNTETYNIKQDQYLGFIYRSQAFYLTLSPQELFKSYFFHAYQQDISEYYCSVNFFQLL